MNLKRVVRMAAVAALVVAFGASPADAPAEKANLLRNPGLDEIVLTTGIPKSWYPHNQSAVPDSTVAYDGKRSLKFQFQGVREETFWAADNFPVKTDKPGSNAEGSMLPGKPVTCRVSFMARTLDLGGSACVFVYRYPTMEQYVSRKLTGTNEWQKLEVDVPIVPASTALQVRVAAYADWGEAWFCKGEAVMTTEK